MLQKQFLLWGLVWLQKKISKMTDAEVMDLNNKAEAILGIKEGSPLDLKIDAVVKKGFPLLRAIAQLL
jgi:hypothetical protein